MKQDWGLYSKEVVTLSLKIKLRFWAFEITLVIKKNKTIYGTATLEEKSELEEEGIELASIPWVDSKEN